MRWRGCVGFVPACVLIATTHEAFADGEAYDGKVFLDWTEDAEAARCITRDQLVHDVEVSLGRQVFAARASADRRLRVDVGATEGRFTAHMLLLSASGASLGARELSVETGDCAEVEAAFALALSIMADLPRTREEQASARAGAGAAAPPTPAPWRGTVGLGAVGAVDTNGDWIPGGQLGLVVRPPRFVPFAVAMTGLLRSSSTPQGMGYALLATTVAATLCAPPLSFGGDRFAWMSCAGPDVAVYLGWGDGFTESRAGVSSTVGGALQTYLAYSFTQGWRAFLGVTATATPQRVSLAFSEGRDGAKSFYRTPFLTAFASIGVAADIF